MMYPSPRSVPSVTIMVSHNSNINIIAVAWDLHCLLLAACVLDGCLELAKRLDKHALMTIRTFTINASSAKLS